MLPSSHVFFSWFHSIIINCYSVSKTKHADLLLASLSNTYLWIILWTTSLVSEWIDVRFNWFCCAFWVLWWADFLTSLFQPIKARLTVRLAVPAHAFPPSLSRPWRRYIYFLKNMIGLFDCVRTSWVITEIASFLFLQQTTVGWNSHLKMIIEK